MTTTNGTSPGTAYPYLQRPAFLRVFAQLQAATGREHDQSLADTYYNLLSRWLTGPTFVRAAEAYLLAPKPYFPTPGDLLDKAGVKPASERDCFARLLGRLEVGDDPETVHRDQPPMVHAAVQRAGGIALLAQAVLAQAEGRRVEAEFRAQLYRTVNAQSPTERALAAEGVGRRRLLRSGAPRPVSSLTDESVAALRASANGGGTVAP